MSQQADGLKASDRQTEEKGLDMQCINPHEKTKSYAFLSSKSTSSSNNNIIYHAHQNSFIDDDLVTWLQYPLDDGVACYDMFQHWPPSSPPPPPSLPFAPSPVLKDPLHQQNEALMVDLAPNEPLGICEGRISVENDRKPTTHLNQASCSEGSILQEVLKQRVGEAQPLDPLIKHGNEVASAALRAVNMRQVGGGESESVSKDCRKLPQVKLLPQEDVRGWTVAKEAPDADTHSRHIDKRIVEAGEDPDIQWAHTAYLRQQPQHAGVPYLNVAGSSSDNTLLKEASVNSPHREDPILVEKVVSGKLSATSAGAQAMMNAQANLAADAALALGAGRAAGLIRPSGVEAFSKVRTSLRPLRPSKLGSPPAVYALSPTSPSWQYTSYPTGYPPPALTPRGRAFGFHDFALSAQPFQQTLQNAAQPYLFRPCANFSGMGSQEHQSIHPVNGDIDNSSKSLHSVSSTSVLLGSQGREEISVRLKQLPCAEQAKIIGAESSAAATFGMAALDMQKPSGLSLPYRDRKDDVVFSGGSETSESLKETFSGSKRKLDDSECQSEDAEVESTVNSQSRSSNSKRTRANEVHNLSERRRRNRINDKMNALRDLIPNASKSNKAALLDEAIDYLKNLQSQLQVMSMRTGVSLSPMVLPPGLPHMQMPCHPMGIGMTGGCSSETGLGGAGSTVGVAMCDMTYGIPAGSLTSLTSPSPMILQLPANNSNIEPHVMRANESASSQFPHPFVYAPAQPPFPVNMDVYNSFVQHQQPQQHLHHQEQPASPQVQPSSQQPPLSQQQPQYQL